MNKKAFIFYVNTSQLRELKMALAEGGRWLTTIPDHPDGVNEDGIDFCPSANGYEYIFRFELKYLNSFPPREKFQKGGKIRIQFNNEQRRHILSGKYKLLEE